MSSRIPAKDARKIPKNPLVPIIESTNSFGTFDSTPTPIIPMSTPKYIALQISKMAPVNIKINFGSPRISPGPRARIYDIASVIDVIQSSRSRLVSST